jgi:hypothetical protein
VHWAVSIAVALVLRHVQSRSSALDGVAALAVRLALLLRELQRMNPVIVVSRHSVSNEQCYSLVAWQQAYIMLLLQLLKCTMFTWLLW